MNLFTFLFVAVVLAHVMVEWWLSQRHITHIQAHRQAVPEAFRETISLSAEQADGRSLIRALVKLYKDNASTPIPNPWYSAFHNSHLSIEEIQRDLMGYLHRVEEGETVVILRADAAVAETKPVTPSGKRLRPFGLCAEGFTVPDEFEGVDGRHPPSVRGHTSFCGLLP